MAQLGMKFPPTLTEEQGNRMVVVSGVPAIATVEAVSCCLSHICIQFACLCACLLARLPTWPTHPTVPVHPINIVSEHAYCSACALPPHFLLRSFRSLHAPV